ncbi:LysM domain-containing protein, partial [Listeria monocytogenes]|nr:LysM domain-containing protein [Listeria monocytogenes]
MKKLNLKSNMKKSIGVLLTSAAIMAIIPLSASAHCDTMDGPVVVDGKKAMESNNVNYVMKWVAPEYQKEITDKFNLSMKVKDQSPEAKELAEQYFFSEVVRVHRAGEDAPFDGLKPSGTPIDEKVLAADKSIE